MEYVISTDEQKKILATVDQRTDAEAARIKRYLAMPDLSRTPGSPIHEIVARILASDYFKDLDTIETPEIVPADISFDLFDFPRIIPQGARRIPITPMTKISFGPIPPSCGITI